MIPDCISFNAIPHTTASSAIFFPTPPTFASFIPRSRTRSTLPRSPSRCHAIAAGKRRVADALEKQNRAWGASDATLRNIQRLREGAFAVVTGQQVGLFGGPLLSLFKAASVLALAKQVQALGVECVPVFWMASEDHDLAEVNQALLLTHDFQLAPFTATTRGVQGAPVASIRFAEGTNELVAQAARTAGRFAGRRLSARELRRRRDAFQRVRQTLLAHLREQGSSCSTRPIADLHRIAAPLFVDAIAVPPSWTMRCWNAIANCRQANYHEQVKVTGESDSAVCAGGWVRVPDPSRQWAVHHRGERISADELQTPHRGAPENFSANVLLRPVLQDYWLPTLAYIGGPAEVAYFAQVAVVYEKLLGRVTPILPRMSATLDRATHRAAAEEV